MVIVIANVCSSNNTLTTAAGPIVLFGRLTFVRQILTTQPN